MRADPFDFRAHDGLKLHALRSLPETAPKAIVVLVHGYAEHSGRYTHVIDALNAAGYGVYTYDHRSHGRSEGRPRAYVSRFDLFLRDLHAFATRARTDFPALPLFLFGHSMGGLITVATLIRYPIPDAAGAVISGAPIHADAYFHPALVRLGRVLSRIAPSVPTVYPGSRDVLSTDPKVAAQVAADPLNYKGPLRPRMGTEIADTAQYVIEHMHTLTLPLYILHGRDDKLVAPSGSEALYAGVASTDKTLRLYDGMRHEPHNEIDSARVLREIIDWLNAHTA